MENGEQQVPDEVVVCGKCRVEAGEALASFDINTLCDKHRAELDALIGDQIKNQPEQPQQATEPQAPAAPPQPRCAHCGRTFVPNIFGFDPAPDEHVKIFACGHCGAVINLQAVRRMVAPPAIVPAGMMPRKVKIQ